MSPNNNSSTHAYQPDNEIARQVQELRVSDADLREEGGEVEIGIDGRGVVKENGTINGTVGGGCPFKEEGSSNGITGGGCPFRFIPLRMGGNGGTHKPSPATRELLDSEVSYEDIKSMTDKFYEIAFQDATIDKFIRSHTDPHGTRFAKWIHQKLTGSHVWDRDRQNRDLTPHEVAGGRTVVVSDRTSAHVAAWYSPKRPSREVGRHFNLEECRIWMRLHFWAMRESGMVEKSPTFADYYVRFIGHFVAVYERTATQFARDSFRWSANPKNIERYIKNGRKMNDVIGVRYTKALNQLPESELYGDWPYTEYSDQ